MNKHLHNKYFRGVTPRALPRVQHHQHERQIIRPRHWAVLLSR